MLDKELLKKIIQNYEENIKNLTIQLNELKSIARENGIMDETNRFSGFSKSTTGVVGDIEKKRQEIFDSIKKVRDEAQATAKKAMDDAMNNISSSAKSINNLSVENSFKSFLPNMAVPAIPTEKSPFQIDNEVFRQRLSVVEEKPKEEKPNDKVLEKTTE